MYLLKKDVPAALMWQLISHAAQVMQDGSLGPGTLLGIGMPLLSQMITEGKAGEGAGHEMKQADR